MRTRALLVWLLIAGCLWAAGPRASELFERGRKAEKAGRIAEAYLLYSQAAAMEPRNRNYWLRSQAVRSRAALQAPATPDAAGDTANDAPPPLTLAEALEPATPQDLADIRKPLPPAELAAGEGTLDLNLRGDSKKLFEEVARAFGLDCVFDGDYLPGNTIRFALKEVNYRDALHSLEAATGSFLVPLTPKLFLVAKDTAQKRAEIVPNVAVEIVLSEVTNQQDLTGLVTAVQQAMTLEKVAWNARNSSVILRGPLSKVLPAKALLEDLLHPRAQVMVDVRFLQVSRNDIVTYGIDFPTAFSLSPLTDWFHNTYSSPIDVAGLLTFGGGKTLMGIGVLNPALVARMSQSAGSLLLQSEIRSISGQPATFHVGDRYPILNSRYYGVDEGGSNTTVNATIPSFTFEDLGFTLKVTPQVHGMDGVTLDVDAEFKVLTGQSVNEIPVIANRMMKSTARLEMGQWAVLAGLLESSEARNIAGLAGVSRIPLLNALTSTRERDRSNTQVLILLRPSLLTNPGSESVTRKIRVGSDARPISPL